MRAGLRARELGLGWGFALVLAGQSLACAHASDSGAGERQAVIETNMPQLQSCWDDLASDYPGSSGSMLFTVELRRNGSVEWVEITVDELGVAKLGACTVREIKKWRFPEDRKRRSLSFGVGFSSPG